MNSLARRLPQRQTKDKPRLVESYQRDGGHGGCEGSGYEPSFPLFFQVYGPLSWYEGGYVVAAGGRPRNYSYRQKKHVSKDPGGGHWEEETGRVCWEGVSLSLKERREQGLTERQDGDESEMEDLLWSRGQVREMR